jgi:ribosomal protein S18 acetylase RimI-like enzyme
MPVRVYAGLGELPESYLHFFRNLGNENFFLSLDWFQNLVSTALDPGATLRLYAVERDDADATPLVVLVARTPAGQNGSIFSGRWIGRHTLAGMTNYQSIEFAPLISRGLEDPSGPLQQLVSFLCAEQPRWTLIDLNLLDPQAPWFTLLIDQLTSAGMVVRSYFYAGKRFEPTAGRSFEAYIAARSNNERRGIRRHRRQLEETHQVRFEVVANPDLVDDALAAYERVLAKSWKKPEPYPQCAAGVIRAAAEAGALRLGLFYVDEEPVATQVWIVAGGRATIYKLHFDEQYKRNSVGSILTAHLMEHVLDVDGVREVDFGLFDDQHKKAWMTQTRGMHGIAAFRPTTAWGALALIRFESGRLAHVLLHAARRMLSSASARMKRVHSSTESA